MTAVLEVEGVTLRSDRLIDLRALALKARGALPLAALPGGFATRRKGRGLELAEIREYAPGDDLRHIERGATARRGRLHVRQFQEERDRVTLLVADFRPSMFWGLRRVFRSVAAAEALSLVGWDTVLSGGRVGLYAVTQDSSVAIPPRGRVRGMLDVIGGMVEAHAQGLQGLATHGRSDEPPLDHALSRLHRLAPRGADLVIASGFDAGGADLPDRLDALSRRCALRPLLITDAEAEELPRGRYPMRIRDRQMLRLTISGERDGPDAERDACRTVCGQRMQVLRNGEPLEQTARRLVG